MARILPLAITAVLIVAGVSLSFSVAGGRGTEVQQPAAVIDVEVWEALEAEAEVRVYIALRDFDVPLAEQTTAVAMNYAGEVQDRVLRSLTQADISSVHRFRVTPAISAVITASGIEKLAAHPDVEAVVIAGLGERGG